MTIEFEVTEQDVLDFNLFYLEHSKYAKYINRMLKYAVSLIIFLMLFNIFLIFGIAAVALWIFSFPTIYKIIIKRIANKRIQKGKGNDFICEKKLTLKDDYIEEIINTAISSIEYLSIKRIEQDYNHIYVYCTSKTILIPYSAFTDLNQKNSFYNLLIQKTGIQKRDTENEKTVNKIVITILCYGISFLIYALILIWGWRYEGEIIGYAFFSFYFIIPVTSFLASIIINIKNGYLKWLYPFLFGTLGVYISIIVFPKISWAEDVWFSCIIPAFIGLVIGVIIRMKRK